MTTSNFKTQRWIYLPLLFCSTAVLATQALAAGQAATSSQAEADAEGQDEFREVNTTNFGYVGGSTRIGVGVDTEFDGTADMSHIFSESSEATTSGDGWVGFDVSGDDKGVTAGGIRVNHNWVGRDEQGRALRVNKVFGAYDRNVNDHDKVTIGYGQEVDTGFWEAYVGSGLSDKRRVGLIQRGQELFEKSYKYNVGGQVGTFLPDSNIRVRGGLDYAWDDERGVGEDEAEQITVSAGVEKFFQGTPHSVALDVSARRKDGGFDKSDTDTQANLSYRYEFGGDGVYQDSNGGTRRVRVEAPGHAMAAQTVRKEIKTPYKRAVKVGSCQLSKSTVELGSDTFFKINSAKLLPSAHQRLNNVVSQIRRSGYQGNIRITGNTCDIGTNAHNQKLSEHRANAVRRYMAKKGFDKKELIARGLGEAQPKYPNAKASRYKNRRVDIEYVTQEGNCGGSKTVYETAYKTEYKDVVVKQGGISKPSVTWKTESIPSEPLWVKRALHNNIRHSRRVDTYRTTAGSTLGAGFNDPIRIVNDVVTTGFDTPITIDVVANDTGSGLQVVEVGQASNGTVAIVNGAVVYTPTVGFAGADQFTYTVRDRNGTQAQGTVTVTIEPSDPTVNVAPVAQDDEVATNINQPIIINVLANDTDADGDNLALTSIQQPANGTAVIVDGQIRYTPNQGFSGTDTIRYTITDGNNHIISATATVLVVGNTNNGLTAQNDSVTTQSGQAVTINALGNDSVTDGNVLSITGITQPSNGTAVIINGEVLYTPNQGFTGTDTLTYTITDGNNNTQTATISIVVTSGVNVAPVVQNDDVSTAINQAVTINAVANDSDADGDTLSVIAITQPTNGSASIIGGQIVYTPNQGFSGVDTLTYTVTDGNNHTETATVVITVSGNVPVNVEPVAQDDVAATQVNQPVTVNVVGNDSDADGDVLIITSITQPANGTASIVNGQIVYTPNQNFTGEDTLTYTITDSNNHIQTATLVVTVAGDVATNVEPIAQDDAVATTVGQAVSINVTGNDSDADGDTLNITSITQPSNGTATIENGQVVYVPARGFTGTDTLTYTITDGNNHIQTATISVTVTGNSTVNVEPVAQNDSITTTANQAITINVVANDSDADGDTLSVTRVTQPSNGSASIVNGQVVYVPAQGFVGIDTLTYTITDGNNHTETATVVVTVRGNGTTNASPVAQNDAVATTVNQTVTVNVVGNDSDADGDVLTITRITQPANGNASIVNGQIVYTPTQGFTGTDTLTYTITDGNNHTETATVVVTVNGGGATNTGPVAQDDTVATTVNQPITIEVVANDSDADGDALAVTNVSQPSNGSATISNGQIVYTPTQGFIGTDILTYTVSDGVHTEIATVVVTVSGTGAGTSNVAPVVQDDAATIGVVRSVTINVTANDSDADGDVLTITNITQPTNGTASISNGQIVYIPAQGFTGTDTLTYTISDGNNHTQTARVVVEVISETNNTGANNAPVAENDTGVSSGNTVAIDVLGNDSDSDGDSITITRVGNASHGTTSVVQGSVLYTPETGYTGDDSFTYTITDNQNHTSTANVTVAVRASLAANNAPGVNDDFLGNVSEGRIFVVQPLNNDSDLDGDTLSIVSVGSSNYGVVSDNRDGTISFAPHTGYCGPITFTYTVSDGHGNIGTATVHASTVPNA